MRNQLIASYTLAIPISSQRHFNANSKTNTICNNRRNKKKTIKRVYGY